MEQNYKPTGRKSNIVVQGLKDEVLIYDLDNNKAFCLNETSALIWNLCDGENTVSEISEKLSRELKDLVSEEYIWLALNQLKKENLIEENEGLVDKYKGLSRREVIRKIGYGSMIALPIISSIVAPTAVSAQSGNLALGVSCSNDSQCASGNCGNAGQCCVPGVSGVRPRRTVCESDQMTAATTRCCSGRASPANNSLICSGQPGTISFICDPYP